MDLSETKQEICYGRDLQYHGANVYNFLGLSLGDISFVVMDRQDLAENIGKSFAAAYQLQRNIAEGLGYRIFDSRVGSDNLMPINCGSDEKGDVYLLDFAGWEHDQWNEILKREFPRLYEECCIEN